MSPPATKRRKLAHSSDEEDGSEGSFGSFGSDSLTSDDAVLIENGHHESDASMQDPEEPQDEAITSSDDTDEVEPIDDRDVTRTRQNEQISKAKAELGKKPQRRLDMDLQDGVFTAEVFKSNIFKIQVDELLEQVKPGYGRKEVSAENAMRTLKSIIEQLPSREALSIPEAEKRMKAEGVVIPFPNPQPSKETKYKLQYDRPTYINATGSYPLKIATRGEENLVIDLVVTIPQALFQEKDYLNHRYFYKRAYYLACLAAGIKASKHHKFKLSFDCLNGNHLQPVITVQPTGGGGVDDFSSSQCLIRILLAISETTFNKRKLLPSSNCVRSTTVAEESASNASAPTSFYNATLQSDASVTAYLKLLHSMASKCVSFKDACILGRIWLKQRGFGSRLHKGGFGNFEWAALVAILLQPKPGSDASLLSPGYSSYQLFKGTLQFLASQNLVKAPYKFEAEDVTFPRGDATPVFFDGPRGLNILFKMTSWAYDRLKSEAKSTVEMLGDSVFDHFESTFILRSDLLQYRNDATIQIPVSAMETGAAENISDLGLRAKCSQIYTTLVRALTDRVTGLSFTLPEEESWRIASSRPPEDQNKKILINITTHPVNANRTVDHGPAAENKNEAASFRQFWGEKAELRRFKDGSILESVVWTSKDTSTSVLEQIVRFISRRHLGNQISDEAKFTCNAFARLIHSGQIQGQSGISAFTPRMTAFADLEKDIRDLEGLPLQIRHIMATDTQLRYAAVDADSTHAPASLVLQFEGSARWPDDLCAIQRTKIAFLLKLSDLLTASKASYVTRVGLENESQPSQNQAYLDIILPSGFSFRVRIHHDREISLLDRQLKDKSLDGPSREAAAVALALYKQDYIHRPAHTQALQTLCTRFPALSPAMRLTKRWFASHFLSAHISPELIELLVVRTFLQPHPWPVPSCATAGFLRTLLWISRWDWRHTPLIVDFSSPTTASGTSTQEAVANKTLTSEDVERIQTRFEAWRKIDPGMNRVVLFAATNLDSEGTTWTDRGRPEKVIAARMTALARAATQAIRAEEDRVLSHVTATPRPSETVAALAPETLFTPTLSEYDILIHTSKRHLPSSANSSSAHKFKNLQLQQSTLSPKQVQAIDYNPVKLFAEELRSVYGDAVLWFWDEERWDVLAGLWNPGVVGRRAWKVKVGWNGAPVIGRKGSDGKKGVDVELNKGAILNEIRRLGGELVEGIEVRG